MRCKVIGVLQTLQQTKHHRIPNDRIIAVPEDSQTARRAGSLPEIKQELEKFFSGVALVSETTII
jgi:hypothetical protein